jgi:hypothetical protein
MSERTWLILQRDLSVWLRDVERATFTTMVLDLTERGTRAVEAGSTVEESLREALSLAAKEPARGMQLAVPDRIQVPNGLVPAMQSVLESLREAGFRPDTVIEEVTPEEGAEWVFDDLISQAVGRQPAEQRLFAEDATLLYEQARRFMEAAPWQQWTSDDALLVDLKIGSQRMEGIATVMGHGSTQPGLLITPGHERAGTLMGTGPGPQPGTLLTQLEGTEGHPDLFLRARRYGWPAEAALTPSFISMHESGFRELDRRESWPVALALAGVVEHFEGGGGRADTWGNLDLPSGRRGRYHVRKAPDMESPPRRGDLIGIKITQDLLSEGSEIQIGLMPSSSLSTFRQEAEVVVRGDAVFPAGIRSVPVITITPSNRAFTGVVDRLKRARPLGVTVFNSPEGPMLTVMGQRAGYVIANDPAMSRVWERNLKESDGAHVLIVSDGVTNIEEPDPDRPGLGRPGHVYGLFECVLRGGIA